MLGQMHLLGRFPFLAEAQLYGDKLRSVLLKMMAQVDGVSEVQCAAARGLYEQFVAVLQEKGLVTADDAATYNEV
jgi:hypothetical protein